MKVQTFFDDRTSTLSYVVHDSAAGVGVVIDPVLDFDPVSGRCWTDSADTIADFLDAEGLTVPYVLDTHAHADHLSALSYFRGRYGAKTVIGAGITTVHSPSATSSTLATTSLPTGVQVNIRAGRLPGVEYFVPEDSGHVRGT